MERHFLLLLFLLILNLFDTIKRQYCKLLQHEGHFLFCRHSLWELLLWRVIPVCQKACFSPFHRPLLSPRLAQGEASGSIPTLIFIYIQRLGFGRLQKKEPWRTIFICFHLSAKIYNLEARKTKVHYWEMNFFPNWRTNWRRQIRSLPWVPL